jgi:hypothetical protein
MEAAAATAMAEGHRAGCHRCCKGHGHCTCEKLFPHKNLLHSIARCHSLTNNSSNEEMVA